MPALENYKSLQIVLPSTRPGGLALNSNFRTIADYMEAHGQALRSITTTTTTPATIYTITPADGQAYWLSVRIIAVSADNRSAFWRDEYLITSEDSTTTVKPRSAASGLTTASVDLVPVGSSMTIRVTGDSSPIKWAASLEWQSAEAP